MPNGRIDFNPQYCAVEAIRLYQQALDFGKTKAAAQADALQGIAEAERSPDGVVPKHYPKVGDDPGLPPGWAPDPHTADDRHDQIIEGSAEED